MDGQQPKRIFDKRKLWSKLGRVPAPSAPRLNEQIGGGFIVIERDKETGRLRPSPWPFEHATLKEAVQAASDLQAKRPDSAFSVFHEKGCTKQLAFDGVGK